MGGAGDTTAAMDAAAQIRQANLRAKSGMPGWIQNRKVFGVARFACMGGLLYGYNQGVFSGVLDMHSFEQHMGDAVTNQTKKGWLTSILELGAWFGALYSGPLCERYSRKYTILANVCVFCIGVMIQVTAVANNGSSSNILGGQFVTGMGVGSVPMYNAEIAPPEVRGSLVAMQQLAITFGIMVTRINYGTNHIGGTGEGQKDAAWLLPLALQLDPAVILGIGMIFKPFSPLLTSLRELPADGPVLQLELLEIKAQSIFEKRCEKENLFTSWPMVRRVMVATGIFRFPVHRVNAVFYYTPSIFAQLGMSNNTTSLLATGVVGIAIFLATIPAVIWVDRLGRKPVLIVGAIGMASCQFIIAGIFAENENQWDSHQTAGWGAVAMLGPLCLIIIAEIWPLSVRSKGTSLGASANWMNNFIVGQVTPDMLEDIRYGTYIFFGLITSLGAVFVYFLVPETKQLSLEEMDTIFGSQGTAAADFDRQAEIAREIRLDEALGMFADRHAGVEVEVKREKV
ncbi:general substrate transporter [Aspergillus californicus]